MTDFLKTMPDLIIKKEYANRFKGWGKLQRQDLMLYGTELNDQEFILYLFLKCIVTDWDSRHHRYQHFQFNKNQLKFYTNWSDWKLNRAFQGLKKKGFIVEVDKGNALYKITGYELLSNYSKKCEENPFDYIVGLLGKVRQELSQVSAKTNSSILNFTEVTGNFDSKYSFLLVSSSCNLVSDSTKVEIDEVDFDNFVKEMRVNETKS